MDTENASCMKLKDVINDYLDNVGITSLHRIIDECERFQVYLVRYNIQDVLNILNPMILKAELYCDDSGAFARDVNELDEERLISHLEGFEPPVPESRREDDSPSP